MLVRIIYFFSFKTKEIYNATSVLSSSKYYSLPNNIINFVFFKSGVAPFVINLDSKFRQFGNSLYNSLMQLSLVSQFKTTFSANSLILNDFFIQKAILNFNNVFYNYLTVSKVLYLDNVTLFQYVSNTSKLFFVSLFDKFLADIAWDNTFVLSQDLLNTKFRSNILFENLADEDLLLNGAVGTTIFSANHSFNELSLNLFGNVAGLVFNNYYSLNFNNPDLIQESRPYYYSFSNLYKFYSVDIFRTSFLFFENVRHSTKLEIVWTIVPTLVLVLIAMHHLRYCILMMSR